MSIAIASKIIKTPRAIKMIHNTLFNPKLASETEETVFTRAVVEAGGVGEEVLLEVSVWSNKSMSSSFSSVELSSVSLVDVELSEVVLEDELDVCSFSTSLYKFVVSAFEIQLFIQNKRIKRIPIFNNFDMFFIPPKNNYIKISYTKNAKKSIPFLEKVWIFSDYRNKLTQNSVIIPNKFITEILSILLSATRLTEAICSSFK